MPSSYMSRSFDQVSPSSKYGIALHNRQGEILVPPELQGCVAEG
eukprot:CAMPEP_0180542630 /NCGR_PEP_ID=MMETSP1036_2-20121128/68558_1 /TAXON_ID=632150 /ORGANISM="Azadinium spinosum, Strain 3D9" /LENGTH=43 /DNA_ID= /DNA_START= /DNA_END= /DNA_ORIENTATION=